MILPAKTTARRAAPSVRDWLVWGRGQAFRELERMRCDMERLLAQDPASRKSRRGGAPTAALWAPLLAITENDQEYLIKADLGGVANDDVSMRLENHVITLSGVIKPPNNGTRPTPRRGERPRGHFTRSLALPEDANTSGAVTEFNAGSLQVRLPKDELAEGQPQRSQRPGGCASDGSGASGRTPTFVKRRKQRTGGENL